MVNILLVLRRARPGHPRLAPRYPPRPHPPLPKSASITTGESVPALTAGVVTCASSCSVEAHTKPCTVLAGARLRGSHDYSTALPSPSPHLITPSYSLTRYTQPFPPVITPINVRLLIQLVPSLAPPPPLPNFTTNPLGAVPKKQSGKWRYTHPVVV